MCSPLLYCPPVLCLWCADETSSAQWTICVPCLYLLTRHREEASKERSMGLCAPHASRSSLAARTSSCLGRGGTGPAPLRFLPSTRLLHMKQEATDGFVRDTVGGCNSTERFLLLHHTLHHARPLGSGKTVHRML